MKLTKDQRYLIARVIDAHMQHIEEMAVQGKTTLRERRVVEVIERIEDYLLLDKKTTKVFVEHCKATDANNSYLFPTDIKE